MYDLILVDSSYYMHRAYWASLSADLRTVSGFPTGILKFMANMMHGVKREYPESRIVMVFDPAGDNFRHELYPEYKANRDERPEDMTKQFRPLCDMLRAMGFTLIKKKGFEADDIIGTLARRASEDGLSTMILTGDKDLGQFLVYDNVVLYDSKSEKFTDAEALEERLGITPKQVPSYLAMCGDTSDNIPGTPGIGPKLASKLLTDYGSIKGIYRNLDDLTPAKKKAFKENRDQLKLSLSLTRCNVNVPVHLDLKKLGHPKMDKNHLRRLFREYNLNFMWAR